MDKLIQNILVQSISHKYVQGGVLTKEEGNLLLLIVIRMRADNPDATHEEILQELILSEYPTMDSYWTPLTPKAKDNSWYTRTSSTTILYWLIHAKSIFVCRNIPGHPTVAVFKIKKL